MSDLDLAHVPWGFWKTMAERVHDLTAEDHRLHVTLYGNEYMRLSDGTRIHPNYVTMLPQPDGSFVAQIDTTNSEAKPNES